MQTDFIAVPPFWSVGQTIDYMGALPYLATASLAQKQAAQRASVRMTAGTTYAQARTATIGAASDLYGASGATAVADVWTALNVK